MKMKLLGIVGTLVTLLAMVAASQACLVFAYQPKAPKNLR